MQLFLPSRPSGAIQVNPKAEISLQELKFPLRCFGLRNWGKETAQEGQGKGGWICSGDK